MTPQETDRTAHVTVRVPADAELWFNGTKTKATGPKREFHSPDLTPGCWYSHDVPARWKENGREVTQSQTIGVAAGARVVVDLPLPPTKEARAKAGTSP